MNFEASVYNLLLLSAVSSVLIQIYKYLVKKFGVNTTKYSIYIGVFILSLGWAVIIQQELISQETLKYITTIFFSAIGIYEVIIKRLGTILNLTKDKVTAIFRKK